MAFSRRPNCHRHRLRRLPVRVQISPLPPLHRAALLGELEHVKALVKRGADIEEVNGDGETALVCAVRGNAPDVVEFLLEGRPDCQIRLQTSGVGLLHLARANVLSLKGTAKAVDLTQQLVEEGVTNEIQDVGGYTALTPPEDLFVRDLFQNFEDMVLAAMTRVAKRGDALRWSRLQYARPEPIQPCEEALPAPLDDPVSLPTIIHMPLVQAVIKGDVTSVRRIIVDEGFDPNSVCEAEGGGTIAHGAAKFGRLNILSLLYELGADLNARNSTLFTPCHFAAQEGHADAIDLIAQLGGNCSLKNAAGAAPVHMAAINDRKPALLALLKAGCDASSCDDDGYTPACRAAHNNSIHCLRVLQEQVGGLQLLSSPQSQGATPLWLATHEGNDECLRILIDAGCDIEAVNSEGFAPVAAAVRNAHAHCLRLLILAGCNLSGVSSETGQTLAHNSCAFEDDNEEGKSPRHFLECLRILKKAGALLEEPDKEGDTPAHYAAHEGHLSHLKYLFSEAGCDLKSYNARLVNLAVDNGHLDCLEFLDSVGCNLHTPYKSGLTPLFEAANSGHANILQWFERKGFDLSETLPADLDSGFQTYTVTFLCAVRGSLNGLRVCQAAGCNLSQPVHDGSTPFFVAAQNGHLDCVKFLLHAGCSPFTPAHFGTTPFMAAILFGQLEVFHFLIPLVIADIRGPSMAAFASRNAEENGVTGCLGEVRVYQEAARLKYHISNLLKSAGNEAVAHFNRQKADRMMEELIQQEEQEAAGKTPGRKKKTTVAIMSPSKHDILDDVELQIVDAVSLVLAKLGLDWQSTSPARLRTILKQSAQVPAMPTDCYELDISVSEKKMKRIKQFMVSGRDSGAKTAEKSSCDDYSEENSCQICMCAPRGVNLIHEDGTGHFIVCVDCADLLQLDGKTPCPMCRRKIVRTEHAKAGSVAEYNGQP